MRRRARRLNADPDEVQMKLSVLFQQPDWRGGVEQTTSIL